MALLRRILVPVDFSPCSLAALHFAATLADEVDASVDVLHVHPPDEFNVGSSAPSAPNVLHEAEREMERALVTVKHRLAGKFSYRIVHGDTLRTILENSTAYDLIVMGTHGRVGRLRALLGSVAEAVVRNASCPVLTIRVPGGEKESFDERRHESTGSQGARRIA